MSWSSASVLLSPAARERCVARLKLQPTWKLDCEKPKAAAVLIPLCVVDERVSILYTLRSSLLKNHSGQISFPGGMADPGETAEQTAVRETEEELGLPRSRIQVWGAGGVVPGRNYQVIITPVVGFIPDYSPAELQPCADEVDEVFTVPITELCDPKNHGHTRFNNFNFTLPVFIYDKYKIWGITALMTHIFLRSFVPKEQYINDLTRNPIDPEVLLKPSKL